MMPILEWLLAFWSWLLTFWSWLPDNSEWLLGLLALLSIVVSIRTLASGQIFGFETSWGVRNGSLGGWRLSAPLAGLTLAALFSCFFLALLIASTDCGPKCASPANNGQSQKNSTEQNDQTDDL